MGPNQLARTLLSLAAVAALAQTSASFQQQAADTTALISVQQQQQQQQKQQLAASGATETLANQATAAKQVPAKSNHRLVSKLKDARHRRRHRHQLARQQQQQLLAEKSAALLEQQAAANTASLTALESIVEEVARAGQLPAVQIIQQHQHQQQQQQQQQASQQHVAAQQPPSQLVTLTTEGQQQQQVADSNQQPAPASSNTHLQVAGGQVTLQQQQQQQPSPAPVLPPPPPPQAPQTAQQGPPAPMARPVPSYNSRGFFLTSMLSKIMNVLNVTEFALEMRDGISSRASCMACNAVVGLFLSPLYSKEVFSAAIRTVCTSFKIQTARVCTGLVESFQDDLEFIRKNTKLTRDEVCAVVFGVDCARRQTYNLFWTVPIPEPSAPKQLAGEQNTNKGLILPLSEQAMTHMEDAPDLFEYRKSAAAAAVAAASASAAAKDNNQPTPQSAASSQEQVLAKSPGANQNSNTNNQKSGKMLKRPEYIFDDEHVLVADNEHSASEQHQQRQQNKVSSFVHITDIHVDPYYETGSLNDCSEPLCCRATSGPVPPGDKRRQAGKWGDYGNCDSPVRTIRSALNRIREQHSNAEYWIWTGDISPHDIWNISKSEAASNVRLVSKMVRDYSNGLPVFPVIGNHEAHPVNSFAPPEIKGKFSMSWLYDLLADEWSDWLPKEALQTLRVGGFYKLQVRKGFRIIALNTNYCARLNPWSFYDPVDPANQLKWLVDELLEAELNQDKVHIIGHVPPDNRECTQAWLFNFINIVDRFKDTIVAQFYGHTHRDEWRIIYSLKRADEPIGIQYIGPSITPFTENNPAYRVYHQDRSGYLLDSQTYFFNLTEANESPSSEPNWKFSYSTQTHLNMTQGLTPGEWHQYLQRLHDDEELFDSFFKNYYRSSDVKFNQVCKSKCKYQMLSDLRLTHPYKTKPKPFLANRKTSNHHRDRHHHHHHHHHHKRLRHLQE